MGPVKTLHHIHLLPLSEAVNVPQQPDLRPIQTTSQRSRSITRSQSLPQNTNEEDSEDEKMGMDWLWLSTLSETANPPSFRKTNTGTLRPEAPEFIPLSQSMPSQEYFLTTLATEDTEAIQPPTESEEEPA